MAPRSNSDVSFAKITLPYPIFAVDFDPYNRDFLVVGGGGGESKTGVPNQISVLDVVSRVEITVAAELPLSRDEDSVQSLGSLATREGLITFAGINSSQTQQNDGNNEHLRSFEITYPPRKKQKTEKDTSSEKGVIKPLGKSKLFQTSSAAKKETYQRILRLSPPSISGEGSKRIGAIATGLAKDSELIVFNATKQIIGQADVLTRITPHSEVADIDIIDTGTSEFSLVYCTDTDIYEQTLNYDFGTKKLECTPRGPRKVFSLDSPDASDHVTAREKFRSVRFINADNVLALVNRSNKGGAELRIYHLYPTGPAFQLQEKSVPSRIKQATSLDVCAFDEDADGNQQIAVAVAGQDISIELYTLNYKGSSNTFSSFRSYLSMKDVHEHQMTKIAFSPFHTPIRTTDSAKKNPLYLRLASVSYGNTVVVDSLPLKPLDDADKKSRYVLSHPSDERFNTFLYLGIGSLLVVFAAFLLHPLVYGSSQSLQMVTSDRLDHVVHKVTSQVQPAFEQAGQSASSVVAEALPTQIPGTGHLLDMIDQHLPPNEHGHHHHHYHEHEHNHDHDHGHSHVDASHDDPDTKSENMAAPSKALVVRPDADNEGGVSVQVHHDKEELLKEDTEARHWHELEEHEKATWRRRLIKAGQWVEGQSEKVLMGVLFSEYGGMVGQVLG